MRIDKTLGINQGVNLHIRKSYLGKLLFFIPAGIVFAYGIIYSSIRLFIISFQKSLANNTIFAGLENYKRVLTDRNFYQSIENNAILIIVVFPLLLIICVAFSSIIYDRVRGGKFFQFFIMLPYILSVTVIGSLFSILLQKNGIINEFFKKIGLDFLALDWLGNSNIAIITIALIIVWKEIGFGTILFLSRLGTLPEEQVDAIRVDGANKWQIVWYLYIPYLKPIITFYAILVFILMLSWVFNYVYVMTGGSNNTMVFELYTFRQLFMYGNRGIGSAAAVLLSILVFIVIFLQMKTGSGIETEKQNEIQ